MSKQSAVLLAVVATSVLAVLTGPRREPAPSPDPGRESPVLPPEHIRAVGKFLVTADLIDGRLTLSEAATRFRELERLAELPGGGASGGGRVRAGPWSDEPAVTDADRLYLRVLAHVEAEVESGDPDASEKVFARLKREYLGLRSGGHPLVVPGLPPERRAAFLTEVRQATERAALGRAPTRGPAR